MLQRMNKYVNLNRVEYIVTYQCSSKCVHCHVGDGNSRSPQHIAVDFAVHLLREVGQRYALDSVMTFGGEPLLYPEVVCAIHQTAKALNIPKRQVITNGYWTKNAAETKAIAELLAGSGVNDVSLSVDAFHQEHVPLARVKQTVTALSEAGIPKIAWNPCWLVSAQDQNVYNLKTRAILAELQELSIPMSEGNVMMPEGRARTYLGAYFHPLPVIEWTHMRCQDLPYMNRFDDLRTISVEPNGDIPLCKGFMLGNALQTPIHELLANYNPYADPDMQIILNEGVAGLVHKARSLGNDFRDQEAYSLCDACTSVRRAIGIQKNEANR